MPRPFRFAVQSFSAASGKERRERARRVDAVCEELGWRRAQYGISCVTVGDNALESFAPVVARLAGK